MTLVFWSLLLPPLSPPDLIASLQHHTKFRIVQELKTQGFVHAEQAFAWSSPVGLLAPLAYVQLNLPIGKALDFPIHCLKQAVHINYSSGFILNDWDSI